MTQALMALVETASWLSPLAAALWGLASVLLSPCHASSVPLTVGFLRRIEGQALGANRLATWVTAGVALSLVVVATVTLAAGRIAGDLWGVGPWLMISLLLLAGLVLLDAIPIPAFATLQPGRVRSGRRGALAAGGVLGLTLGPCTFAFFAPLLAFAAGGAPFALKGATISAFVLAHLSAIWLAGVLGARIGGWMKRSGRAGRVLKIVVGIGLIALAVEQILVAA